MGTGAQVGAWLLDPPGYLCSNPPQYGLSFYPIQALGCSEDSNLHHTVDLSPDPPAAEPH